MHISEISNARIPHIQDVIQEGQMIDVKVLDVNDRGQSSSATGQRSITKNREILRIK